MLHRARPLLLREIDRVVRLFDRVAACFPDHREPRLRVRQPAPGPLLRLRIDPLRSPRTRTCGHPPGPRHRRHAPAQAPQIRVGGHSICLRARGSDFSGCGPGYRIAPGPLRPLPAVFQVALSRAAEAQERHPARAVRVPSHDFGTQGRPHGECPGHRRSAGIQFR